MQRPVVDDHAVIEETIEQCVLADRMGFDTVWFVEHHFLTSFSMSPCPEVIFGALSRLTKRIRLGFGVVILPYHHPVRVAERVAMVDHLSGGRVEFGTGRSAAYEQMGMGIDPRNTRAMWEESLRMIPQGLGGRPVLLGGPVLERPAARRAPQALPEAAPRHLGGGAAARDLPAGRRAGHRRDGAQRRLAVLPRPAHRAVQGARPPRQAGREVHQRPVAELHHGAVRAGQQGSARAGRQIAADLLRARSAVPQGPDAPLRAARGIVGRRAGSPARELRPLYQDGRDGGRARPSISPAGRDRSPRRCGIRSTPTRWWIAASSSPAIPRAVSRASPSTRKPASTSCSS